MAEIAYFSQECPTCGRSLRVRVEYLGRFVVCQHCRGRLMASDAPLPEPSDSESGIGLLRRADELLEMAEQRRVRPR